ncbi:MAG: rod shape-determining protein RodA [Solirubrobacteraceae bacterium]
MKELLRHTNWKLLLLYSILVGFGILNLFSVSSSLGKKQFTWLLISILILIIISIINIVFLELYSILFYCIGLILLIGIFAFGKEINGAKAWYAYGGFTFQPAEFMKFFIALFLSKTIQSKFQNNLTTKNLIICFIILGIPAILILLQPDLGSVIIFTAFLIPLYREGLNGYIFLLIFILIILFFTSIFIAPIYIMSSLLVILISFSIYLLLKSNSRELELNHNLYLSSSISYMVIGLALILIAIIKNEIPKTITIISFTTSLLYFYFVKSYKNNFKKLKNNNRISILTLTFIIIGFSIYAFSNLSFTIFNTILKPHQKERILVLIEGESKYRRTSGYNLLYSKTAIGSGEFFGKGYLNGTVTAGKFVPEQETDYIFTTIGEEWGFLGSSTIIIIYCIFIGYIYKLAEDQRSRFGRIYGYSIASIYLLHFTLNIAMIMGLFPTVGIPLPFFSYGGTSFVSFSVMFFVFLKLNYRNNAYLI